MSTTSPVFNAGGLASGLDTNTIVDKLVALESQPITTNNQRQAALNVQVSTIGDLMSRIKALATSAATLGNGVVSNSVSSTPAGITAVSGTGATPASYSIAVTSVASAAKARSGAFNSANDTVAGGSLLLSVKGQAYTVPITANSDLGSVVQQINHSGAPVTAAVISDGTKFYIAMANRDTGKPIGSADNGGLSITSDATGINMVVKQNATNAAVTIDGDLHVESQTNDISTAIPGVTISVKSLQTTPGDLVITSNASQSASNLNSFVSAYNSIMSSLQQSLRPDPKNPPAAGTNLDGSTVLTLERAMQGLLSSQVVPTGTVRTLADMGVKLQNDGTLTLDSTTFNKALSADPGSVDAIFSTASTGIAAKIKNLSTTYTDSVSGQLVQRQTSLQKTIKDLQAANSRLQDHVDNFKAQMLRQFTQMETTISNLKSISSFITANGGVGLNTSGGK